MYEPGAMCEECGRLPSVRVPRQNPQPPPRAYGYAVVDVEASGSSSRRHRVVELAVVLLDGDLAPQGEFSTLVDPQGPVGPTHIHGIEPGHLGGAPPFAGIARRLLGLLRGRVLVGHNVGCDRAFLAAEYARVGLRLPAVPEVCTMRLAARAAAPDPAPYGGLSLPACAAAAGISGWRHHTALGDARVTARLFAHLAPRAAGLDGQLAEAARIRWPKASGVPAAADALWMRRRTPHGIPYPTDPATDRVTDCVTDCVTTDRVSPDLTATGTAAAAATTTVAAAAGTGFDSGFGAGSGSACGSASGTGSGSSSEGGAGTGRGNDSARRWVPDVRNGPA